MDGFAQVYELWESIFDRIYFESDVEDSKVLVEDLIKRELPLTVARKIP